MSFTSTTVAGLKLWLKADAGITLSGSNVTAWADQSGNGNDVSAISGHQPTVNASSINGLPGLTGVAATSMTSSVSLIAAGSARTVIAVIKPSAAGHSVLDWGGAVFANCSTVPLFCAEPTEIGGVFYATTGAPGTTTFSADPGILNNPTALEVGWDGNSAHTVTVVVNGASPAITAGTGTTETGSAGFSVFSRPDNPSVGFCGDICEILVYDHVLSGGDLTQVRAYLQTKYAISLGVTALSISPSAPTVAASSSQTFTGADGSGTGYTYSITVNNSGGSINSSTGVYTAGATGSVTDTVRVTDSVGDTADATVTVTGAGPRLSVTPGLAEVIGGNTQTFVGSGGVPPYAYSISTNNSGSTINPSTGVYDTTGAMTDEVDVVTVTDAASSTVNATVGCVSDVPSISPGTVTLNPGDTNSFLGNGGIDTSYTWAITVNNSGGSINSSNGDYAAGSTGGVTDTVQLTDAIGFTATATVTITGPVQISPTSISVEQNGSTTFTAVGGTTPYSYAITVNNSGGSIDASTGVYTAGSTGGVDDTVEVTDASTGTSDATVHVTVMTISPTSANVPPLGSQTFTAVGGTAPYSYAITVNNSGGTINSSTGVYTAGSTPNCVDTIEVTDAVTSTASAVANVGDGVTLSPGSITLAPGGTHTFTASGGSGTGFVYSFDVNGSGGTINSSTGFYTAGNVAADDLIIATDSLGNVSTDSTVIVPGVVVSPSSATTTPLGSVSFSATGGSGTGYTWALVTNHSGGSINPSTGVYTAGATGGVTDAIQATDNHGNTSSGTAITVTAALSISPTSTSKPPLGHQTFTHAGGTGTGIVFAFVHNHSGGSLNSSTGAYVAGATGSVTDTISVTDSLGGTAQATVSVTSNLIIAPTTSTINKGSARTFTHSGGSGTGITFSLTQNQSGGTIDASTGVYTAGSSGGVPAVDIILVSDDLGNTASATVSAYPPSFYVAGVTLIGLSTLRVKYSYPPKAVDPTATNDALHPANYLLTGNDVTYVIASIPVLGDDKSIDCLMAAPLGFGKWVLSVSNVQSADGGQTL